MNNTYELQFHPVWEDKLSQSEKDIYVKIHQAIPFTANTLHATAIRINKKKNHGIAATIYIHNGFETTLSVHECQVQLTDTNGSLLAEGQFSPNLSIKPTSSMPWSFIFSPEMVKSQVTEEQDIQVGVIIK